MSDSEIDYDVLSDEELSSMIDEVTKNLSNNLHFLFDCIKEREHRHTEQIQFLQRMIETNTIVDNMGLHRETNNDRTPVGIDCHGRLVHTGDLVEVISGSKKGKPFKPKDQALVLHSTGSLIKLRNLDDETIIGYRYGKNIRVLG